MKTDNAQDKPPVGRFAPTPSGRMHLGNVLCALVAYLSVRKRGGRFLLRIEDLDAARCPRSAADEIIRDLNRLGFEFDGEIIYQSERAEVYREYEKKLENLGLTYPCFCSRSELHASQAPHLSDGSYVYDGKCKRLTKEQEKEKRKSRPPCIRLRVPDETVTFADGFCGRQSQNLEKQCGDFIIRRSDGVYAYQLAVVADDISSGVTEVVRGEDLVSSTARQIYLYGLFGEKPPHYAHIPLVTASDGRRLSKRDGDSLACALSDFPPERIIGRLAYAAGITETDAPVKLNELIECFSFKKLNRRITLQ